MQKYAKNPDAIAKLSPEQYRVTQQNGTERPGTGEYLDNKEPGIYVDIVSASRSSPHPTSMNRDAAGRASPSPSSPQTSKNCATPRMA
jgi:peptide-methionine (R)-S-oxide reductase